MNERDTAEPERKTPHDSQMRHAANPEQYERDKGSHDETEIDHTEAKREDEEGKGQLGLESGEWSRGEAKPVRSENKVPLLTVLGDILVFGVLATGHRTGWVLHEPVNKVIRDVSWF
jgi:hypothetical protein